MSNTARHFVNLTATHGGLWAGTEVDPSSSRYAVLTWRYGQPARRISTFDYGRHVDVAGDAASVQVVAVTPAGGVLVRVQHPDTNWADDRFSGFLLVGGLRQHLVELSGWRSVTPTSVADDGTIVGVVRTGALSKPSFRVVRWSADGRAVTTIAVDAYDGYTDGAGDIGWHSSHGGGFVRRAAGGVVRLDGYRPVNVVPGIGAPGHVFYGYDANGQHRYALGVTGVTSSPIYSSALVSRASVRGDLITDVAPGSSAMHLRTSGGGYVAIPKQFAVSINRHPGVALSESGTVAFTSAADHRVHLFICE